MIHSKFHMMSAFFFFLSFWDYNQVYNITKETNFASIQILIYSNLVNFECRKKIGFPFKKKSELYYKCVDLVLNILK